MNAMFTNRVGDFFLTLGFFAIFFTFGTLDYATVFSVAPYINTNVITFIAILLLLGAAAKSAQLGLHIWLPQAMEGKAIFKMITFKLFFNFLNYKRDWIQILKYSTLQKSNLLYDAIIGDLLDNGYMRFSSKSVNKNKVGNARMEFTFSTQNLPYVQYLKFVAYKEICTSSLPIPWPNPKTGKPVIQYWFSTRSLPLFTKLYNEWYKEVSGKIVKVIPLNINELLKPRNLAHWIMGDGFWNKGGRTVHLSTDSFTFEEVTMLVNVINDKFHLDAKVINRTSNNGNKCWRIRISACSINKLRDIVIPFMIAEMLYKLGIE
jgi:LAGLIDADG DNA endonuclease family/Proton-conducting membrane transporter